jgi:hypothetical protein
LYFLSLHFLLTKTSIYGFGYSTIEFHLAFLNVLNPTPIQNKERERERERINLRKPELISAIKENSPSLPYIFLT